MSMAWNGPSVTMGSWLGEACRATIFSLDKALRHYNGIASFSDAECNLLRFAICPWKAPKRMVDGAMLEPGAPIIDLHLWNERFRGLGRFGPDLGWGVRLRRHLEWSLLLLAERLDSDPDLARCAAIRAAIAFPDRHAAAKFARVAKRFGLVQDGDLPTAGLGRGLLTLALVWAVNPHSLTGKRLRPGCAVYWVSVSRFRRRYRGCPLPPWDLSDRQP